MQTIKLPDQATPMNFAQARLRAVGKADEILKKPAIVAWKDDESGKFAPEIPGGKGDRWHVYGESNEGVLELQVADAFHFIFMEAEGFEEPDTNLASLEDHGTKFLCLNEACTEEDRQSWVLSDGMGG